MSRYKTKIYFRARFTGSFGTVSGLAACTDYIFAVAIISGNNTSGIGPMSNRKTVSTKYSPTAAVKEVKVVENRLTWRAPCDTLESPLSYLIRLRNQVDGKSVSATLAATRNQTISYSPTLKPGDVYSLTVEQVAAEEAERSAAVTMLGPPIPPPTAVFADYANRSLEVHWGQGEEAAAFEVLVTPSTDISQGCDGSECAFCMPTNKSPLTINRTDIINNFDRSEKCSKAEFKVAVSTVIMRDGVKYRSRWVPAPRLFVDMSEQHQGNYFLRTYFMYSSIHVCIIRAGEPEPAGKKNQEPEPLQKKSEAGAAKIMPHLYRLQENKKHKEIVFLLLFFR